MTTRFVLLFCNNMKKEVSGISYSKNDRFDASALSNGYEDKGSLSRFKELQSSFPNILIIFEHAGFYYGFDETAVALYYLFGCRYYRQKGMLVVKVEATKFEEHMIGKKQMRGFRYVIDRNGKLTFEMGKKFSLPKTLSYYDINLDRIQKVNPASSSWSNSYTKNGRGWYDDVWLPGLPSQRFYKKRYK